MASSNPDYPQNKKNPNQTKNKDKKHCSNSEKATVHEALNHIKFLTRRQLSELTGIEISVMCRILNHLVYRIRTVKVAFSGKCSTTKKRVMYFTLNKDGGGDGK